MTMIYALMSDRAVLANYQPSVQPGVALPQPSASTLQAVGMPSDEVEWLKQHYLTTELELRRCYRFAEEGPCECDL